MIGRPGISNTENACIFTSFCYTPSVLASARHFRH